MVQTLYHRLIVPADSNHKNTLYAGSLLRLALEAGYATAWKHIGPQANLVLRRVLNLECLHPVPVGTVIKIEGAVIFVPDLLHFLIWAVQPNSLNNRCSIRMRMPGRISGFAARSRSVYSWRFSPVSTHSQSRNGTWVPQPVQKVLSAKYR
jgi:hypothetical protein